MFLPRLLLLLGAALLFAGPASADGGKKEKGILLPKKVEEIDPLGGVEKIPLENIKVNEGIADEEFSRW